MTQKEYTIKEKLILAKACIAKILFLLCQHKPDAEIITDVEDHCDEFLNYPNKEQAQQIIDLGQKVL